ncbi:hypothetical protein LCGC14_2637310 [marine sediment metagenome]|uniref:Uncharacterized protein n=1 Tax=marine sediment metagenome TaxID=412755 RepID=A0A0F9CQW1_9ZZZZ
MLNISKMSLDNRYNSTTLFIKNIGRAVQAKLSAPAGAKGERIEGELEGYRDEHLIVRVKYGSSKETTKETAKKSTKRILWPFVMLDEIHFPEPVT